MRSRLSAIFAILVTAGSLHAVEPAYKVQRLAPSDTAASQFGAAVAMGENVLAVGAYLSDANGRDSGAVYLYRKGTTGWTVQEPPLHAGPGEWFGFDVAIQGNQLIVGAPHPGGGPGAAYIYDLDARSVKKLTVPGARNGDEVGSAVAIDGNYAVVGARGVDERKGAVYVFSSDGGMQTLTADPRVEKAEFGQSLALRGGRLVVGAPSPYAASHSPGAAYLFELADKTWRLTRPLDVPAALEERSTFGYAVAIADRGIVVGAPLAGRNSQGQVFLFNLTGSFESTLHARSERDQAGVAVAADGTRIVLGAVGADSGCGSAYLYQDGDFKVPLVPAIRTRGAGFGFGTAIRGETVVVGAFKEKGMGAAYVFEPETVKPPQVTFYFDKTTPIQGREGETVSVSVVLDTDRALTEPVTAKLSVNGSGDVEVSPAEVIFPKDSKNGDTQTVQVSFLADCLTEGQETFHLVLADAASMKIGDRAIKVRDGDNAAGLLSRLPGDPPLVTDDSGREEVFELKLTCQPAAEVAVTLASTDPAEGKVVSPSPPVLHFLPENWNVFQAVTVRGQQDGDGECTDDPYQITFTLSSADPPYNGFFGPALDFVNEEDKGACISATADEKVCADADGTVLYTFTIENPGSRLEDLAGPELSDTLPEQVRVVAATADLGVATVDYAGNSVAWNGSIPSGATVTIQVLAALEPDVNSGTEVKDQDNSFRYGTDGKGPEATFTVGEANACQ